MQYSEIIKYFETEEGLNQLLEDCKDTFNALDELTNQLQGNVLSSPDDWKNTLSLATGHYSFLNPIYTLATAVKENEEIHRFIEEKNELESKGEKVVVASLEKSASLKVANYRKIRNLLEGYVGVSEKIIATAQSQLKQLGLELTNKNSRINE